MMNVEMFELGPVMTNAYLVYDSQTQKGVVFDPGMYPDQLLQRIKKLHVTIEAILLTHAHFDHMGGVEEVRTHTGASVYIHKKEEDWLADPMKNGSGRWPMMPKLTARPAEHILVGGETLQIAGFQFKVLYTPGHSPGSISFYDGAHVFSGDALFRDSIGRTDLYGGDHKTLIRSIKGKLMELPDQTVVYSGHGPETTIERERNHNPFIAG
ncbi:MBL fold metallo-hydrolase [Baia soyae]|uniref:Glyoxylase-like metal-dependent hydrolase (Beta-lactamase superfamily II) n=1 Tax=Baia soyae TaxID=1544746 RepID=A0A4R2S3D8_9BACL|nr:MBL fold metallo-hydrolase [Baia soyae]TCP70454.1 glyoxylase-like metal-dependent hydrolase (beta-lactamase superfamily II) [Baia soyae]